MLGMLGHLGQPPVNKQDYRQNLHSIVLAETSTA